jgi:hypothetical protein
MSTHRSVHDLVHTLQTTGICFLRELDDARITKPESLPASTFNLRMNARFGYLRLLSLQQNEPLRLHKVPCLYSVEVHSAGQISTVKLHLVIARLLFPILGKSDLLAEGIEDGQLDS